MWGLDQKQVDAIEITKKVVAGVYSGVTTVELDQLAAEVLTCRACMPRLSADVRASSHRPPHT